jgi:hypothetical protein
VRRGTERLFFSTQGHLIPILYKNLIPQALQWPMYSMGG